MVDLDKIARLAEALDSRMDDKVATEESRAKEIEADLQQSINDTQAMFGGRSIVYITQAEYDMLSEEEKDDNTKAYFIVDAADASHSHENKDFLDSLNEEDYLQIGADITLLKNNKLNVSAYNDGIAEVKDLIEDEESRAKEVEADLQQSINDTQAMIGGKSIIYITQAEYDLLSEEEKDDDTKIYFVIDAADSTHSHENKDFLDSLNEEDYLQMGADITSLKNNKLNTSVYNDGIAEVKGLIEDEEERATGIEAQLQAAIDGKAAKGHNHDDRYYTETEMNTKLSGKSDTGHNHDDRYYTEVEIDSKIGTINTALNDKAPASHNHDNRYYTETEINDKIEDINEAIEGRAPSVHTHTVLSMKADNFKTVSDAPSTYERGETLFFANAPTDKFNNLQYGLVQTLKEYSSGNAAWQFLYPYNDKTDTFYVRNGQYGEEGWRSWAEVYTSLNKPTAADIGAAPTTHSHNDLYYTEVEIDSKIGTINTVLNDKANTGHNHDDRYYTESEINGKINALNEADANLQANITSEVGKVDAKFGGKSFVYLTQADYDILTDEQKGDTSKIYVITDATDPTHTHNNKAYLDTLAAPTVVQVNPSGTTLTLTTDKYQKTTIADGTQIVFPTVSNFTEIHLYFDAENAMNLTFPDCRWRVDPNIEAGKSYEIVATYNTIRWLVNVIVYS
jgi:PHD/YefM family antitoxin component YafN of YafNO toxin-antitoxin module